MSFGPPITSQIATQLTSGGGSNSSSSASTALPHNIQGTSQSPPTGFSLFSHFQGITPVPQLQPSVMAAVAGGSGGGGAPPAGAPPGLPPPPQTPRAHRAGAWVTQAEAQNYRTDIVNYVNNCEFLITNLGGTPPAGVRPQTPDAQAATAVDWVQWSGELHDHGEEWTMAVMETRAELAAARRGGGGAVPPQAAPAPAAARRKFPTPGKYEGKVGDSAITFLTQCQNYITTEGQTWTQEYTIRWALQLMEGKAGPWAELQLRRMVEELDDQGDPPRELQDWDEFVDHFKTQWYDQGARIANRRRWKEGISQTGSAREYFSLMENLIVKLSYDQNSREVLDIVQEGLKLHIRTHFALTVWRNFRTMKAECIQYDEAYYAQTRTRGDTKKQDKGKGKQTPKKAETSVMGTKRLSDEDWEMCKVKGLCFVCKKIGKDVLGLAKEHPNHPKRENTKEGGAKNYKKDDKKKNTKNKTANVKALDTEHDSDVDKTAASDSDSDDQPEGSKN